jgi:hypothetical protein
VGGVWVLAQVFKPVPSLAVDVIRFLVSFGIISFVISVLTLKISSHSVKVIGQSLCYYVTSQIAGSYLAMDGGGIIHLPKTPEACYYKRSYSFDYLTPQTFFYTAGCRSILRFWEPALASRIP